VNRTSKMLATKSAYKPSPSVFPLYASASVHTKLDLRMPTILKVFIVAVLVILFMVSVLVSRVMSHKASIDSADLSVSSRPAASGAGGGVGAQRSGAAVTPPAPVSVNSSVGVIRSVPVDEDLKISGCMASATKCRCYNYHSVALSMSDADCRSAAAALDFRFRFINNDPRPVQLASVVN